MQERLPRPQRIWSTTCSRRCRWPQFEKNPLVDALLDRLQHHCITIRIDGPSLRAPTPPPDKPSHSRKKTASKRS